MLDDLPYHLCKKHKHQVSMMVGHIWHWSSIELSSLRLRILILYRTKLYVPSYLQWMPKSSELALWHYGN